jgi:hypothetical protein
LATHFFKEADVSSGKTSESLQDPYWICQGSSTERPKVLPKDLLYDIFMYVEWIQIYVKARDEILVSFNIYTLSNRNVYIIGLCNITWLNKK